MKLVTKFLSVLGLTVALSTNAAAAVTLVTGSNGTLMGASSVDVGGTFYDVTFGDGILNASAITAFTTAAGAQAASLALMGQVFTGLYANQTNIQGCSPTTPCLIVTPYALDDILPRSIILHNSVSIVSSREPSIRGGSVAIRDTSTLPSFTIARWTMSTPAAAVPEPESYAMMFAGLGLLGFVSSRRKQKAAV